MAKIENKNEMATNVFNYAAQEEAMWKRYLSTMGDYQPKTTFYAGYSIAEWYGDKAINDTYKTTIKSWLSNLEYATELVMVLNHKCWEWYERRNEGRSLLYTNLYRKAYNLLLDKYGKDEKAMDYIFKILD